MSAIDTIQHVTGLKREDIDAVWLEVKANKVKLDSCPKPHDFSIFLDRRTKEPIENPTPEQRFGCYWRCSKCGGRFSQSDKMRYCEGLKDGHQNQSK